MASDPGVLRAEPDGVSIVRLACYRGRAELGARLVELGAEVDPFDAAALGDVDRLRDLLDDDPDAATAEAADGFSALHLAAWFGRPRCAELLLARGADPEQVAGNGTDLRPLHSAAAAGQTVIAHLLLDRGADIEAPQQAGVRALHSAAHRDDAAMVALLLDRGADPAAATDDGRTARDLASDPAVLALLP
ncbi:MAG: ankyrin repeat domain-containing protein [Acidimicrobiales bacterium]|nr:ankyrin repeat domain-containing protein [Acidimicrobiales bacterium]